MGKRAREKKERKMQFDDEGASVASLYSEQPLLEKICLFIIKWGAYLITFTPLIFIRYYFFPFVVPKTIFFRILVDIISVAYILLVVSNRKYLPKMNALAISVMVFISVVILTSFTGINLERSFWSTFERMTGIFTFLHLLAFFIILIGVFKERDDWEWLLNISILAGVLVSVYALFFADIATTRSGGTIGNISFLAAYLLFDIFFAIILFFSKKGDWSLFFKIFYVVALILMLASLFFAHEFPRGAIGAFFPGLFLLGLSYMVFSGKKLLKKLAPIVLAAVVLVVVGFTQTSYFKEKMLDIKDFPGLARKLVWAMAYSGWEERPWLGWGPENFSVPFSKHFNPELPLTADVWYDRAHNIILDTLVSSGILGLLSYLAIFFVAASGLLRAAAKVTETKNIFLPLGTLVLLLVYFAQNIFVFDMISSYMVFFLSLAFAAFLIQGMKPQVAEAKADSAGAPGAPAKFAGALLIAAVLFSLYLNVHSAKASYYTVQGISSANPEGSIASFEEALAYSPMAKFEVPEQFGKKVSDLSAYPDVNKELIKKGYEEVEAVMKKNIASSPLDYRAYLFLGRLYINFFQFTNDKGILNLADETLRKAMDLSPENQQTFWALAQVKLFEGKNDEAVGLLKKAVYLEPRFSASHWYLAMTYKITGKNDLALSEVNEAKETGYNWDENIGDARKVIELYQALGNATAAKAIMVKETEIFENAVKQNPSDVQSWIGLAETYADLGDREKARAAALKVGEINPDYKAGVQEFLKRLGFN